MKFWSINKTWVPNNETTVFSCFFHYYLEVYELITRVNIIGLQKSVIWKLLFWVLIWKILIFRPWFFHFLLTMPCADGYATWSDCVLKSTHFLKIKSHFLGHLGMQKSILMLKTRGIPKIAKKLVLIRIKWAYFNPQVIKYFVGLEIGCRSWTYVCEFVSEYIRMFLIFKCKVMFDNFSICR